MDILEGRSLHLFGEGYQHRLSIMNSHLKRVLFLSVFIGMFVSTACVVKTRPGRSHHGVHQRGDGPPHGKHKKHKKIKKHKKHKKHKAYVHWWRTYPDEFAPVWKECEEELKRQPNLAATALLRRLQVRHPGTFKDSQLRTLQRRVRAWRLAQMKEPVVPLRRGDSLPEEHELELVVPYPTHTACQPPSVRF